MSRRYCFAPGCSSKYRDKVSIFKVPKNMVDEWSHVVPRADDKKLSDKDALCEKHFTAEDVIREVITDTYSYALKKPRLKEGAIPTLWPNCPKHLYRKIAKKRKEIIERQEHICKKSHESDEAAEDTVKPLCSKNDDIKANLEIDKHLETNTQSSSDTLDDHLRNKKIMLPTESWTIKFHGDLIALFETAAINNNVVITKKVVVSKSFINLFVFEHLQQQFNRDSNEKISPDDSFEEILFDFHKSRICCGFPTTEDSIKIDTTRYRRDTICNTLRHESCKYLLNSQESLRKKINYCFLCQNAKRSIRYMKNKMRKLISTRQLIAMKNAANCRKRERRLRKRLMQAEMELRKVKEKMKMINDKRNTK